MILLKSPDEILKLRESNRVVAVVLEELKRRIKPGVLTRELDELAEQLLKKQGALPAFKNYRGYKNTICASVNEQVVHGIPSKRKLKEGDILSIDIGALKGGYYGDCAVTVGVGEVSEAAERLMRVGRQALAEAIAQARVGNHLYDISRAIQLHAEGHGYSVVRKYVGHGIGRSLHEDPQVPNFVEPEMGPGPLLESGLTLAIEPMLNEGKGDVKELSDRWTVVTADGKLSAHFEHTVAITGDGSQVLSLP
ncbi:MAG: type I methionyl aminopeptidase [Nitrospinota bacterium]